MLGFKVGRRLGVPEAGTEIVYLVDPNGVRSSILAQVNPAEGPAAELDSFGALSVWDAKHVEFLWRTPTEHSIPYSPKCLAGGF